MVDDKTTWTMIHAERKRVVELLETLTPQQWATTSLCGGWPVQKTAGHILAGAEQTTGHFARAMVTSGFRFNTMIERDARAYGELAPAEIITRLRARTSTTQRSAAPLVTMLGEVVVHGADIRDPLGLPCQTSEPALRACLDMYKSASFPVGGRKRIDGLRLVATDADWTYGDGPEVAGPGSALLLAMTGRAAGLQGLTGPGVDILASRLPA